MADRATPAQRTRIAALDCLRGAALCGMIAYHLAWDLAALGWPVPDPAASLVWTMVGRLVAGTFLVLSGVSLSLARPKGPVFALRRLAVIALAGGSVTLASLWFAPDAPILFGILQCIAATNLVAWAALRWAASIRLGLAAVAATAPSLLTSNDLNGWPGAALGLAATVPHTLDYQPVLPWLAVVLAGTVAGDLLDRPWATTQESGEASRVTRTLRAMGRHSLGVYLVHQPVLYGMLALASALAGQSSTSPDAFDQQCRADCVRTGAAPGLCATACACTAQGLATEARKGAGPLTRDHLDEIGAACRKAGG